MLRAAAHHCRHHADRWSSKCKRRIDSMRWPCWWKATCKESKGNDDTAPCSSTNCRSCTCRCCSHSLEFAYQLYATPENVSAPIEWVNSGLVRGKGIAVIADDMCCRAARDALYDIFESLVDTAVELFAATATTQWKALEILFVYRARNCSTYGALKMQNLNLKKQKGQGATEAFLQINEVIYQTPGVAAVIDLQPGCLLACARNHAVVDYVFLAHDSSCLYFFSLSYDPDCAYLEDLFTATVFSSGLSVYEYYRQAVRASLALPAVAVGNTVLPANAIFVHVTTSDSDAPGKKPELPSVAGKQRAVAVFLWACIRAP
eukprot:TRINITY_DN3005_c0_g1_i2.p1 TRINITY_DN3005_c0_g1~~TRINITY_DN3005_c0_g1_i2.p1  ORF type:complete len:318 (+),score=21.47 TRINITY_DN3005_c0_g1_i2:608-1561(+)